MADRVDLLLDPDGDITITTDLQFSSGLQAIKQGVEVRLRNFRDEWFLNLDSGVPYFQDLLGQKFDAMKARAAIRDAVLATPGVVDLISLAVDFSRATRTLSITFEAQADEGTIAAAVALQV